MSASPQQYWLLTTDVPAGPFTLEQVHTELTAGRATWQTLACAVGGQEWKPLVKIPGIGPPAPTGPGEPVEPVPTSSIATREKPEPVVVSPPVTIIEPTIIPVAKTVTKREAEGSPPAAIALIGVAIIGFAVVGGLGYFVYEAIRPSTPREICEQFGAATTATEAKKYVTPRMDKVVEELLKDPTPDNPNDTFELTGESNGSEPGVRLVGCRVSLWIQEAGLRKRMEGHFRLVQHSGWKIDDFIITGMEGVNLNAPISLVDESRRGAFQAPTAPPPSKSGTPSKSAPTQPAPQRKGIIGIFQAIFNSYGWAGIIVVIAIIAAVQTIRERNKPSR